MRERPQVRIRGQAQARFGDRPRRDFGDRPKRDFGDRPRRDYGDRPKRDFGDRPKRDFGDRPRRDFGDRPKRDFGDRPKKDFEERPSYTSKAKMERNAARKGGFEGEKKWKESGTPSEWVSKKDIYEGTYVDPGYEASGRPRWGSEGSSDEHPRRAGDRPWRDYSSRSSKGRSRYGDRPRRDFGDRPRRDYGERSEKPFEGTEVSTPSDETVPQAVDAVDVTGEGNVTPVSDDFSDRPKRD